MSCGLRFDFQNFPGKDSVTANKGSTATFLAKITGNPESIDWEHGEEFLEAGEKYGIRTEDGVSELKICNVEDTDAGSYACVAVIDNIEVCSDYSIQNQFS